jgi:hypothetical protein
VAKLPQCTGELAVMGYCLGGLMTFLTAARYGVDAAVAYHRGDTEKYLGEVDRLDAPLLMHLAEETSSFPNLRKLRSKQRSPANRTRQSIAIRVSITPSLGIMGRTTMPQRQRSPTGGQASSYINICGDLRSLQPFRGGRDRLTEKSKLGRTAYGNWNHWSGRFRASVRKTGIDGRPQRKG